MRRMIPALGLGLLLAAAGSGQTGPATSDYVFPGKEWTAAPAAELGWSADRLAAAARLAGGLDTGGLMVVHRGRLVLSAGDVRERNLVQSVRKSLLHSVFGIAVERGRIDLDATLADLGISDRTPLSAAEQRATVRDLLQSRSGVYLPAIYEFPGNKARKPARGSHAPGERFYYNNWDFNALGTIFERATGTPIGTAFQSWIAGPLGMQDFRARDVAYLTRRSLSERALDNTSDHPAYLFHISTRDLARFGLLYLAEGRWQGRQIVPAAWVRQGAEGKPQGGGFFDSYGMLWQVMTDAERLADLGLSRPFYSASGAGGHFLVIIPELDLVVAHTLPVQGAGLVSQLKRRYAGSARVSDQDFWSLLRAVVAAHPRERSRRTAE